MVMLSQDEENVIEIIKSQLFCRALYKKNDKLTAEVLARIWNISPRQVYRRMAEAEEFFKQLLSYMLIQPEFKRLKGSLKQFKLEKAENPNQEGLRLYAIQNPIVYEAEEEIRVMHKKAVAMAKKQRGLTD